MEYQIWLNGEYADRDKAQIPMLDRGFRIGDVVFDTSRTFNGSVFKLRDHLDRLYRSLKYVRIDPGMSIDEMERITLDVVAHNEDLRREMNDDYMITQIVTGGNGQRGDTDPNISIWIDPLGAPRWAHAYTGGAHAVIPKTRAYPSEALDPKVKHYSRLNFVLAEMEARDVDPHRAADHARHGWQGQRGHWRELLHRQRRHSQDAARQLHAAGCVSNDRHGDRRYAGNPRH